MIEYTLKKSAKRKTLSLKVDTSGLIVYAPSWCSVKQVETLITEKESWIQKHLSKYTRVKKHTFGQGETLSFKGEKLSINLIKSDKESIILSDSTLHIHATSLEGDYIQYMVWAWLEKEAAHFIDHRTHEAAALLGKSVTAVKFGRYKTKWGSCHHDGTIKFNWLLMQAPVPVIEYVIAHEVSHLVEMNHSPNFWAVVEGICPNYQHCRKWLKENSTLLSARF